MKLGAPFLAWKQIHKEFGIVKAAGVAAVIGASDLADHLRYLGEPCHHHASAIGNVDAGRRAGARSQRSAHPDRALIEMRQEFRTYDSAHAEKEDEPEADQA